jgi:hypothetical protein
MQLLLTLLFAATAQAQAPAPPDRSGEPALRRVFEQHGALRNVEALIWKSNRDRGDQPLQADRTITLWYASPGKFRAAGSVYWGEASLYVSDGKTLYADALDDMQPGSLRNSHPTSIPLAHSDLSLRGGYGSVLYYLLEGPPAFEKMVDPVGSITAETTRGEEQIKFKSKEIGMVTLFLRGGLVHAVEYDNLPQREAMYLRFPMWLEKPEDPLEREEIEITKRRSFPRDTFKAEPPQWRKVTDQRKKPPTSSQ